MYRRYFFKKVFNMDNMELPTKFYIKGFLMVKFKAWAVICRCCQKRDLEKIEILEAGELLLEN
jgi:hypothetical protein